MVMPPKQIARERITAKTVRYGVFVATQNKLGENPIFDANGNVTSGVISAEITIKSFDLFELKVSGFTDEHKDEKLAPRRRSPILGSVAGFGHKAFEIPLWQKTGNLSENVLSEMHIYTKFDLAAKVRISKVRQGFRNLLCCA
jgi:hypothetical protein